MARALISFSLIPTPTAFFLIYNDIHLRFPRLVTRCPRNMPISTELIDGLFYHMTVACIGTRNHFNTLLHKGKAEIHNCLHLQKKNLWSLNKKSPGLLSLYF